MTLPMPRKIIKVPKVMRVPPEFEDILDVVKQKTGIKKNTDALRQMALDVKRGLIDFPIFLPKEKKEKKKKDGEFKLKI